MGQRLYETSDDLLNEERFLCKIERRFKCEGTKMPIRRQFDYVLTRTEQTRRDNPMYWQYRTVDVIVAAAELKCRRVKSTDYPTCVIGEHKVRHALNWLSCMLHYSKLTPLHLMFFVRYLDCDKSAVIKSLDYKRERFTARNHADDPTDTEWVLHIPLEEFRTF